MERTDYWIVDQKKLARKIFIDEWEKSNKWDFVSGLWLFKLFFNNCVFLILFSVLNVRPESKEYHRCGYKHEEQSDDDMVLPLEMKRVLKPVGNEKTDDHADIKAHRPNICEEFIVVFVHLIGLVVNIFVHLDNNLHSWQKNASKRSDQNDQNV